MARFTPEHYHCAGPKHFVNGGILATLVDCHCVCTAAAAAYRDAGRRIGTAPDLHYATARLDVSYLRPAPTGVPLELRAHIVDRDDRTYVLSCDLDARGKTCVRAVVEAVAVPDEWIWTDRAAS